jgi:hypothetical protein
VARPQNGIYRRKINSPLLDYKSDVTSQCGEDGIIAHICEVIEPANRYCIEFGAWDGKHLSNCYNLIVNAGWSALMIEANAEKFKELEATYAGNPRVKRVNRLVDFEGADTLDRILEEAGAPKEPGVLSIDIDGNDYYIFESVTQHRPELVIVEFNPTIPNDVIFVQERSFEVNHGCSLLALVLLAREKGYELAVATEWNAFFVRKEKFPLLGIVDNSVPALYAPLQDGRIFQGYDSSIHVVGMDQLIWQGGVRLSSADFQVLPESVRHWGDAQKKPL